MKVTIHASIADIPAADWNALAGSEQPFLRHEFLLAAEQSDSVSPRTGWTPRHITITNNEQITAAMPLYEKSHSWGEFVFDWSWAQAYEQAGLRYYPKLVSAIPFTPAPSRRLLLADQEDGDTANVILGAACTLARETECSSLHILFPDQKDLPFLRAAGLKLRKDCQFHWQNRGYADFDEFLATFSSKKRKKVRQDRRRVTDAGISFRHLHGKDLDESLWRKVYGLISTTFMRRGALPYFEFDFFPMLSASLPENILVILAERNEQAVAAAVFFESEQVLYGRYWGSDGQYDALHFETCYYQGIEYCIAAGIASFEPGTQGEHKISRGFLPVETWSAHWLGHPEFFSAIGNYVNHEIEHIDRYMQAVDQHSPYRKDREPIDQ
jgi:predicted N-acyltransferase